MSTLRVEGHPGTTFMSYRTISPEPICQRAWVLGSDGLHLVDDAPMPDVGENDVLVRIKSVALSHEDLNIDPTIDSLIPGTDAAGEVVRGRDWEPGEPVVLPPQRGMLREYVAVPGTQLVQTVLDFDTAAAIPTPGAIAVAALAGLRPGDWVLTGSGDVSVQALLFAKAAGAHVVTTTSKITKTHHLRTLGADFVVNTRGPDPWGATARALTPEGRGFDYVLASGWRFEQASTAVREGGVLCVVGRPGVSDTEVPNVRVIPLPLDPSNAETLKAAVQMGEFAPPCVNRVFAFNDVPRAYDYLSDRRVGRVVVRVCQAHES